MNIWPYIVLASVTLGGHTRMEHTEALRVCDLTIDSLKRHMSVDTALGKVSSHIQCKYIKDATYQVVNGKIYRLQVSTNIGTLVLELQSTLPPEKRLLTHFILNDIEYVEHETWLV